MEFIKSKKKFLIKYLSDPFFDSLKRDYEEFDLWYKKSCDDERKAGFYWIENNKLLAFIGLKAEQEKIELDGVEVAPEKKRLKITTIKSADIISGFSEFVIYQATHLAIDSGCYEIYLSVIPNNDEKRKLLEILETYGFKEIGKSKTSSDGKIKRSDNEIYLLKNIDNKNQDWKKNYPLYNFDKAKIMVIQDYYHDVFLPDAKLKYIKHNFDPKKMGIKKAYVHNSDIWQASKEGDLILIYRKSSKEKPGFSSVITSVGKILKTYKKNVDYNTIDEFNAIIKEGHAFDSEKAEIWFNKNNYITMFIYLESFGEGNNRYNWRKLKDENIINGHPAGCDISEEDVKKIIEESKRTTN